MCLEMEHKFEPRYDSEPALRLERIDGRDPQSVEAIMRGIQRHTYICDVCVKCGKIVQRPK